MSLIHTDTQVDLTINKLTPEQYAELSASSQLDENQVYVLSDTNEQYIKIDTTGSNIPTKTSDLTNDSGFTTSSEVEELVGTKIEDPETKESGQVLTYDGEEWVASTISGGGGDAPVPKALPDYLYELDLDDDYEEFGKEWRRTHFEDIPTGGCTTLKSASYMGRNYDWEYTDGAEFVLKLPKRGEKYASVGIASLGKNLTETMVKSGEYTDLYKALPGMTTDGINEKGLCASIHVVRSIPSEDAKWEGTSLDAFGAVRYVLDNFDNAEDAATWIAENVYLPSAFVEATGYSVQFIVGDANDAFVAQDGMVFPCDDGVLTNFRTSDGEGFHHEREEVATYDPYGMGIERYATALELMEQEEEITKQDIIDLMRSLNFTNAYVEEESPWYSDFTNPDTELSLDSPDEDFEPSLAIGRLAYEVRDRFNPSHVEYEGQTYDVTTWQTNHNSIYDIDEKTLTIYAQEGDEPYVFKCPMSGGGIDAYTKAETDELLEGKADVDSIPTSTSELTNDSGFITSAEIPEIPSKTSDLTNDSGFITEEDVEDRFAILRIW